MAHLIVVTFADKYTAEDMLGALRRLQKDEIVRIDDAAVIIKDEHGQVQIPTSMQEMVYQARRTGAHSVLGLLAGTLVGMPLLGGVLGGVGGKLWDRLTNESLSKPFIRQVRETMPPTSSALFALGEAKVPNVQLRNWRTGWRRARCSTRRSQMQRWHSLRHGWQSFRQRQTPCLKRLPIRSSRCK